jgi:hypothetical protein
VQSDVRTEVELEDGLRHAAACTVEALERAGVRYAVIGGVALRFYLAAPRATRGLDLAVYGYDRIPRAELRADGFAYARRNAHSDNWLAPAPRRSSERVPVRFVAGGAEAESAVTRARPVPLGERPIAVCALDDLTALKLLAAEDAKRPVGKRQTDVRDLIQLSRQRPELLAAVPSLEGRLRRLLRDPRLRPDGVDAGVF